MNMHAATMQHAAGGLDKAGESQTKPTRLARCCVTTTRMRSSSPMLLYSSASASHAASSAAGSGASGCLPRPPPPLSVCWRRAGGSSLPDGGRPNMSCCSSCERHTSNDHCIQQQQCRCRMLGIPCIPSANTSAASDEADKASEPTGKLAGTW